jgi:hypothetical protein
MLVLIVDSRQKTVMEGYVQTSSRSPHDIAAMSEVIGKVKLPVSKEKFDVWLGVEDVEPVPRTDQIVVFMNVELLIEA